MLLLQHTAMLTSSSTRGMGGGHQSQNWHVGPRSGDFTTSPVVAAVLTGPLTS